MTKNTASVYSIMIVVKNIHILYGRMTDKDRMGHKQKGEKVRLREMKERVRDRVWLEKAVASVVKMTLEEKT